MDTWSVPLQAHWTDNKGQTDGSVVLNLNPLRNYGTRKSIQKYNIISKCTGLFSILFLSQLPIRTHYLGTQAKSQEYHQANSRPRSLSGFVFLCDSLLFQSSYSKSCFNSYFSSGSAYCTLWIWDWLSLIILLDLQAERTGLEEPYFSIDLGWIHPSPSCFYPFGEGVPDSGKITAQLGPKLLLLFVCFLFLFL